MTLHGKFRLTVAIASIGLSTLSGCWLLSERSRLISEKEEQARNLVSTPYSIIEQQYGLEVSGKISRAEAQKRAAEAISAIRYDRENYYWINDMHPTMVMHPMEPQLNGQDLTTYTDPTGRALFVEMVEIVRMHREGFVRYEWPSPGAESQKPVPKLSFVKGFGPWGWIIGTGIYVDDVDAAWRVSAATAVGLGSACLAVLLIVSVSISGSIFPRLRLLMDRMKDITAKRGDFSHLTEFAADENDPIIRDEIDCLVSGFKEMVLEIRKRDERLRQHEEELEQLVSARTAQLRNVNSELATAHAEIELFLQCIPSILIGLDTEGRIRRWNLTASQSFGVSDRDALGRTLQDCGIKWLRPDMEAQTSSWLATNSTLRCDDLAYERNRSVHFVGFSVRPIFSKENEKVGLIVTGADVTEKKCLEEQLRQAQKLEAIGQLAAGIAHEINTPTQFIGDNTTFLKQSWEPILKLLNYCRHMQQEAAAAGSVSLESLAEFDRLCEECDLGFLAQEIPHAIDQSLEGLQRVAKIVRAMKEFSHRGSGEKEPLDLNRAIEATITVARGEWKHVADVVTALDPDLPMVTALAGELKQAILNLVVNAAHAIADVVGDGTKGKGKITISTSREGDSVQVTIGDTGTGIPDEIRTRVFEPFFTSKPVGKGTGQGLALAHSIIVKGHQGKIWFDTKVGEGTTFFVRLPLQAKASRAGQ